MLQNLYLFLDKGFLVSSCTLAETEDWLEPRDLKNSTNPSRGPWAWAIKDRLKLYRGQKTIKPRIPSIQYCSDWRTTSVDCQRRISAMDFQDIEDRVLSTHIKNKEQIVETYIVTFLSNAMSLVHVHKYSRGDQKMVPYMAWLLNSKLPNFD